MSWSFNPPPGWSVPPGFVPPQGWVPDPSWPPAPGDWTFWVPAEQSTQAPPPSEGDADPYRLPAPGWSPQPAAGYGYTPAPTAAGPYGAPTYGGPGYPAPGYGTAYGAPAYGTSPPPRKGMSGGVIALIIAVVLVVIVGVVVAAVLIGRGIGGFVGPAIQADSACSDALYAVQDDGVPPSRAEALSALPKLRAAETLAKESLGDSPLVTSADVVDPLNKMIGGYTVFASLPPDKSTWSGAQSLTADQALADINDGYNDLYDFCGYGDSSSGDDGGVRSVSN